MRWALAPLLLLIAVGPAQGQEFPALTGRVVDEANLLNSEQEETLTRRLEELEQNSSRQLVVATIADLQGYPVEDYGYRLGRHWGIGQAGADNGAILLVAPNDRRVRIEAGYGLEPILTDAFASQTIDRHILPRFRANDYAGGIMAGADAIIEQLQAPPEAAEQRVLEAAATQREEQESGSPFPLVFWTVVLIFVVVPMLRSGFGGRRYRRGRRRRGFGGPVVIWGPGMGGGWGGGSRGGWSGGGFGGGGFSGGGGGFGGGGASGGW